jgi:hypothetical protein
MAKKIISMGIPLFLLVFSLVLAGCGGGKSALAGRWYKIEGTGSSMPEEVELLKNGTGFALNQAVTWKTENKRLYITHPYLAMAFDYKLTGSMLELSNDDGQKFVYVKEFGGKPALVGTWEAVSSNGEPIAEDQKESYSLNKNGTVEVEFPDGTVGAGSKWIAEGNLLYFVPDDNKRFSSTKLIFEIKGRTLTMTNYEKTFSTEFKKK